MPSQAAPVSPEVAAPFVDAFSSVTKKSQ